MRSPIASRTVRFGVAALPVLALLTGGVCLGAELHAAADVTDADRVKAETSREETERALAAAQQRLDASVREVEQLSSRLGAHYGNRFVFRGPMVAPRAMLGVQIRSEGGGGAHVQAVSPGGPAEAAGIKEGDVITTIDGKDLTKADDSGRALIEALQVQEPERKVKIRLQRDGKSREVEVTTRAAPQMLAMRPGMPGMPGRPGMPDIPGSVQFQMDRDEGRWERGAPLAGMELATVSESLGKYFGAKEGVLVVRAGRSDAYKLQDGDVIVAIDGREPNSASHATRILRSYQRGEKLQMKVLRDRKPVTLDVTLPGG